MTWEQQIRQEALSEGRAEGRAKGRAEGLAEGELKGLRHTMKLLLTARFGALSAEVETQIDEADATSLEALARRFPSFEGTLEAFLGPTRTSPSPSSLDEGEDPSPDAIDDDAESDI